MFGLATKGRLLSKQKTWQVRDGHLKTSKPDQVMHAAHDGPGDDGDGCKDPEHELDEADKEVSIEAIVSGSDTVRPRMQPTLHLAPTYLTMDSSSARMIAGITDKKDLLGRGSARRSVYSLETSSLLDE